MTFSLARPKFLSTKLLKNPSGKRNEATSFCPGVRRKNNIHLYLLPLCSLTNHSSTPTNWTDRWNWRLINAYLAFWETIGLRFDRFNFNDSKLIEEHWVSFEFDFEHVKTIYASIRAVKCKEKSSDALPIFWSAAVWHYLRNVQFSSTSFSGPSFLTLQVHKERLIIPI